MGRDGLGRQDGNRHVMTTDELRRLIDVVPFGATLYTVPSKREETYICPSRSNAIEVAFIISATNGFTL